MRPVDTQIRQYFTELEKTHGPLTVDDILERTGDQPAIPRPEARTPSPRRRWVAAAVAALVILVTLISIRFLPAPGGTTEPIDQPTTTTTTAAPGPPAPKAFPTSEEPVALEAGTYLVDAAGNSSIATFTVTVPDRWTGDSGGYLSKNAETPQGIAVSPWGAIEELEVYTDACHGEFGDPGPAPTSAAELVSALRAQNSGPVVSDPVATTVGGLQATRIDLQYPDREALANCRVGTGQLQVWGGYFVFFPNYSAVIYVVDVEGVPQVFLVEMADRVPAADRAEALSILESISFESAK